MTPVVGFPQVIAARPSCLDRIVFANMSFEKVATMALDMFCESVNKPPPGKLCDQDPDALLDSRWRQDPPLNRLKTLLRVCGSVQEENERLLQEREGRLKAEQEARDKAESACESSIEAKVAWEEARRAHEVARDTLRREELLADIAREQSCISRARRAREQAASAERRQRQPARFADS